MESTVALARLRCTAALLGCTSTASARLLHGGRVLLEVMAPPHPVREHLVVRPSWFRGLVGRAAANDLARDDTDRRGLEQLLACSVELGVRDGTVLLPAHVLRVDTGASWMHVVALAAPVAAVSPVATAVARDHLTDRVGDRLELHADVEVDATVVGIESPPDPEESAAAAALLASIGISFGVQQLEAASHLTASRSWGADR